MFITDAEAIRYIIQERDHFACYLGAGASAEAGVMTAQAICTDIRDDLLESSPLRNSKSKKQISQWENATLNWNDPSRRYSTCIKRCYPNQAARVEYFRRILKNKRPSFCHHATALFMRWHYLQSTCLTTNFDKLLEGAFTQQGELECQPIRTREESRFWQKAPNRYHIIKLHGDYDTHNVLNTNDETISIGDSISDIVERLLLSSGLVVIGTAGYEKSIIKMFDELAEKATDVDKVLSFGLLWGVYMNQPKPKSIDSKKLENLINERIHQGEVSRDIYEMIERTNPRNDRFCFFPVWSAGTFMSDFIMATNDKALIGKSELYLDHEMRLGHVFARAGLEETAINKHIAALKTRQSSITHDSVGHIRKPELIFKIASSNSGLDIRIVYGDITSRSFMTQPEFKSSVRAVVSPEDTCLSAGGGVAYALLNKAGKHNILSELAKFSPIKHGTVAVTSGGELPVHYIFHAAAIEIQKNANYSASKNSVKQTMMAALAKASALEVSALWVPLMGAGVAPLQPEQSLRAILEAIVAWNNKKSKMTIILVVYSERELSPQKVEQCLRQILDSRFRIDAPR